MTAIYTDYAAYTINAGMGITSKTVSAHVNQGMEVTRFLKIFLYERHSVSQLLGQGVSPKI